MNALESLRRATRASARSTGVFLSDVGHGLLDIGHNALAAFGLAVAAALVFAAGQTELRHQVETQALEWLQGRSEARSLAAGDLLTPVAEQAAVARATAMDPSRLTRQQAAVATWISRRYKVAPEPIGRLVQEAWHIGQRGGLDPTLILAVMAVESSFNPFAQSPVGAQGLMQVMTRVHDDKYEAFGGVHAAFDPVTNLRVGVQVLRDCIARAGGSLQDGLRAYLGATVGSPDGGYVARVLWEQGHLRSVADGRPVPFTVPGQPPRELLDPPAAATTASAPAAAAPQQLALLR